MDRIGIMNLSSIKKTLHRVGSKRRKISDEFLRNVSGVIHVGANTGQERELYGKLNLRVIWIEPIPEIFQTLQTNLRVFPNQRAIQGLITDYDDREYPFHVSDNNGESSSVLNLKHVTDIWPSLNYTSTVLLKSTTLASLFEREQIDPLHYQALIIDTQGSELLVLKGSVPVLHNFNYIKTEVADFESYAGCCQLADINSFLARHGYAEISRHKFASRPGGGNYFDIIYEKKAGLGAIKAKLNE